MKITISKLSMYGTTFYNWTTIFMKVNQFCGKSDTWIAYDVTI